MKLFKRTSIFLSIFIVLIWVSLTIWAYYPLNNVRVTDAEKQQTRQLLRKNNITALDAVFDIRIKAVSTPKVQYLTQNKKLFDEACKKGKLWKEITCSFGPPHEGKSDFHRDTAPQCCPVVHGTGCGRPSDNSGAAPGAQPALLR